MVSFYIPLLDSIFISGLFIEALLATKRFSKLESFVENLGQNFIKGILLGALLMVCYLIRINGLYGTIKADGQIHYLTLIWLDLTALIIFHISDKKTVLRRTLFTLFLVLIIYLMHDFFWITKSIWRGIKLMPESEIIYPEVSYYFGSYTRIMILVSLSIWHLSRSLKISKPFLFFFIIQIAYHAGLVIFKIPLTLPGLPNDTILGLPIDALPYLFILKEKRGE